LVVVTVGRLARMTAARAPIPELIRRPRHRVTAPKSGPRQAVADLLEGPRAEVLDGETSALELGLELAPVCAAWEGSGVVATFAVVAIAVVVLLVWAACTYWLWIALLGTVH
jgi:hypothetical protein